MDNSMSGTAARKPQSSDIEFLFQRHVILVVANGQPLRESVLRVVAIDFAGHLTNIVKIRSRLQRTFAYSTILFKFFFLC
jgi:hypothetical protein